MDVSLLPASDPASSIEENRRKIVKQIELAQQIAKENIMRAQHKMKTYYDQHAPEPNFVEGHKVWVFSPKTYKGLSKKLLHNYHGPFRVVEKLSPVHYRSRLCTNKPVSLIVHANHMEHFVTGRSNSLPMTFVMNLFCPRNTCQTIVLNTPRRLTPSQNRTKHPYHTSNQPLQLTPIQYLVKWTNYPLNEAIWEPAINILDPRLLADFLSRTTAST